MNFAWDGDFAFGRKQMRLYKEKNHLGHGKIMTVIMQLGNVTCNLFTKVEKKMNIIKPCNEQVAGWFSLWAYITIAVTLYFSLIYRKISLSIIY